MKQVNQEKGFTFLEAIIAIFVLIIGITAVLQIFPVAFSMEMASQLESQAVFLCQEKMETVNGTAYQDLAVETVTEDPLDSPFEKFSREITTIYVDSNLEESIVDTGFKKITVKVWWKSPLKITEKEAKLITLITQK